MKCPWCGSENTYQETVDVGVGSVPCAPAECLDCKAREIDWRHFAGLFGDEYYKECIHDPPPSEAECKRGWWRGSKDE